MTRNEGLNNTTHNPLQPSDLGAEDEGNLEWVVDERDEYLLWPQDQMQIWAGNYYLLSFLQ